jgi:hypothetical protein
MTYGENGEDIKILRKLEEVYLKDAHERPLLARGVDSNGKYYWLQVNYQYDRRIQGFQRWTLKNFVYEPVNNLCPPGRSLSEGSWTKVGSHDHPFDSGRVELWLCSAGVHQLVDL